MLAKEQRPNGCSLTLAFGDASRPLPAKFKGDVVLGVHEELSAAHGVSGSSLEIWFRLGHVVGSFGSTPSFSHP